MAIDPGAHSRSPEAINYRGCDQSAREPGTANGQEAERACYSGVRDESVPMRSVCQMPLVTTR